ncbi:MAG: TonB-dependent receptor plug domain-containing protein [Rubricoccaceae bacterium]
MRRLASLGLTALLLTPSLLLAPALAAQTTPAADSLRAADLGADVVVTASRLPDALRQTGRHVTVLTAADIAAAPAQALDELLRFAAGVQTTSRGALGVQSDFSIRGAPFNGVLFLVDGARFNDPQTGHFQSSFPVPLAEIARVEILRGPAAAVYGPDALGGVVHVITHAGAGTAGRAAALEALGGGERTARLAASARTAPRPGATFTAALDAQTTDGQAIRDASGAPVVGSAGPVRTDFRRLAGTAALAAPLGAARLSVRAAADARDFGAFQFYSPFASDTARSDAAMLWAQARLERTAAAPGQTAWRVHLAGRRHRSRYAFNPVTPANEHTNGRLVLSADASRALSAALTLSAGASAEWRGIDSNNLGTHADAAGGAFALARWIPAPRLTLTASARLDADPGFGLEPTPMLALAYAAAPALTLRATGGRAVRAPTYVERYLNTVRPRNDGNLGNPDLRAERAWNAEAGADFYPAPGLALRTTAFWRRTDDLIDFARLTPDAPYFLAQNVLTATATGLEADATLRRGDAAGRSAALDLGYALTRVTLSGAQPGAVYKYALGHAPHRLLARARGTSGRAEAALEALYTARVALPSYGLANVRLGYRLAPAVRAHLDVRNVTGTVYTEVFGAPMPGRTWLAGLRLGR